MEGNVECCFFFFQAEDGIRDLTVTGVQTCALPIFGAGSNGYLRRPWWAMLAATAVLLVLLGGSAAPAEAATAASQVLATGLPDHSLKIGRASCRERV